jgi:hypothetical protein
MEKAIIKINNKKIETEIFIINKKEIEIEIAMKMIIKI